MKIDRGYFDNYEYKGKKWYTRTKIADGIEAYANGTYEVWFETGTDEEIGVICESENRTNWKDYYTATCNYGWDGKKATKKEKFTTLCTRGEFTTARTMLLEEYRRRTGR